MGKKVELDINIMFFKEQSLVDKQEGMSKNGLTDWVLP